MQQIEDGNGEGSGGGSGQPRPTPTKSERKIKPWMIIAAVIVVAVIFAAIT